MRDSPLGQLSKKDPALLPTSWVALGMFFDLLELYLSYFLITADMTFLIGLKQNMEKYTLRMPKT